MSPRRNDTPKEAILFVFCPRFYLIITPRIFFFRLLWSLLEGTQHLGGKKKKRNGTKRNETKRNETKRNETKTLFVNVFDGYLPENNKNHVQLLSGIQNLAYTTLRAKKNNPFFVVPW